MIKDDKYYFDKCEKILGKLTQSISKKYAIDLGPMDKIFRDKLKYLTVSIINDKRHVDENIKEQEIISTFKQRIIKDGHIEDIVNTIASNEPYKTKYISQHSSPWKRPDLP